MNKTLIALAALFATAMAPAAHACDREDIAEGECARGVRMPGLRQLLPPTVRPSAVAKEQCDADDAAELTECLRGLKMPSAHRIAAPDAQPAAGVSEKVAPDRTAGAPAPSTQDARRAREPRFKRPPIRGGLRAARRRRCSRAQGMPAWAEDAQRPPPSGSGSPARRMGFREGSTCQDRGRFALPTPSSSESLGKARSALIRGLAPFKLPLPHPIATQPAGRAQARFPANVGAQQDRGRACGSHATLASSEKPAKPDGPEPASLCQKYFPSVGRLITVPCGE